MSKDYAIRKRIYYRVLVSVVFGLIGFGINFLDIQLFESPAFKVSILAGLLFPLLIALAWGWRYGLLSALAGGCQAMWWLWRTDGYGLLYAVPVFTLWVVWHGYWADRRRKADRRRWYHSSFSVEIPFRVISELGFYTIFRGLVSLNPPPWNPSITWDYVALDWVNTVAIKHTITAYLLLLVAHILLSIVPVRRFFGLKKLPEERLVGTIYAGALLMGSVLWAVDSVVSYLIFNPQGQSFWNVAILNVSPHDLFMKNMYILISVIAGVFFARLITTRAQAEEALRESEERYRNFVDNATDAFSLSDMAGRFYDVNNAACDNLGYEREELLDMSIADVDVNFPPDKVAEILGNLEFNKSQIVESAHKRKNGTTFPVDIRIRSFGTKGEPFLLSLARDITARKQAEQALRESEEKFRTLVEQLPTITYIAKLDKTSTTLYISPQVEKILGIASDWYIANPNFWLTHIHDQDRERVLAEVNRAHESGQPFISNYRMLSTDGRIVWLRDEAVIIKNDKGFPLHLQGVMLDITERVRAEEEKRQMEVHLRQQQKLESIGTLASGVAHEINNPIMGIMNYAQLIHDRIDPAESRLREFSAGIIEETERVAEIVRNLLTFSRQDKQTHSPARMTDIVNDTLPLIRTIIKRDQITLQVDVPNDLPQVRCRSQQIQQVLMNLLTNARDALNQRYPEYDLDKVVTLTVRPFEKEGQHWLRTTVEDHGAGIPAEIREHIFDPFYTTKDRAISTGLGLSISIGIVQDHHGELTFESEEGQPTRFYLDLPVDNEWEIGTRNGTEMNQEKLEDGPKKR
ncbi:MAG: PAS domain S-box protein [Anaerolineaceae bacterium]|nr:PAS domain S-box protein [Anaerolineaceae bacterium]